MACLLRRALIMSLQEFSRRADESTGAKPLAKVLAFQDRAAGLPGEHAAGGRSMSPLFRATRQTFLILLLDLAAIAWYDEATAAQVTLT